MFEGPRQVWEILKQTMLRPAPPVTEDFDPSVLESDRSVRALGYLIIAFVFLGFGGWAVLAPLESAARGLGTVQVEGNRKPVQHLEGGIVTEIFVESGDYVEEGQALLKLDDMQLVADQKITEGRLWAKRAAVDRLRSERDGMLTIEFDESLKNQQSERAVTAVDSERALFEARRADRFGEVSVLEQRISQLEQRIQGTDSVLQAKESVAESLRAEIKDLEQLLVDGYVDKQRIRQLERSLAQTLGEMADLRSQISSARVAIEESRLEILQLTKRFISQVVDALTLSQEELFDLQQRLAAISDRVERTTIRSPASGVVLALQPNTFGAVIGSGQEIMAIVPDVAKLIIDVQMSPLDIDRISVGQVAEVRFAVFKDSYTITGELVKISADSLLDDVTGAPYYEAKVELLEEDLDLLGNYELVPGMPADVLVKTGSRTLLGYLTSPLQRMFENSLIED